MTQGKTQRLALLLKRRRTTAKSSIDVATKFNAAKTPSIERRLQWEKMENVKERVLSEHNESETVSARNENVQPSRDDETPSPETIPDEFDVRPYIVYSGLNALLKSMESAARKTHEFREEDDHATHNFAVAVQNLPQWKQNLLQWRPSESQSQSLARDDEGAASDF